MRNSIGAREPASPIPDTAQHGSSNVFRDGYGAVRVRDGDVERCEF